MILAFDRAPENRYYDDFGRLHVRVSNIAKACVSPYQGSEIPNHKDLGLDPNRVYMLLRDPVELEEAAATFNNVQLLDEHVPVTADKPQPKLTVGSTGDSVFWEAPFLKSSLVVWDKGAIEAIEDERVEELSPAYAYVADMTPGKFEGLSYDGIMRNIVGNHVALVEEGRQGPEVVVGDEQPEIISMAKAVLKSRKALLLHGALSGALLPLLAADAKINLAPLLANVTRANFKGQKATIATGLKALTKGKLAQDADLDGVIKLLDSLEKVDDGTDEDDKIVDQPAVDAEEDPASKALAFCKGKMGEDDYTELTGILTSPAAPAADEDAPAEEDDDAAGGDPAPAMDKATVRKIAQDAETRAVHRVNAMHEAITLVEPIVGKLKVSAFDSAAGVHKFALDHLKIATKDVHPTAYKSLVEMHLSTRDKGGPSPVIAQDAKGAAQSFAERFPTAAKLKRA